MTTRRTRSAASRGQFDSTGFRKATIAALASAHQSGRFRTLPDILIALEVIDAEMDGEPHTMRSLSETLDIPYTSVSRIVFGLTAEGGEGPGILTLSPDPEDRRRKVIGVDRAAYEVFGKNSRKAAEKALVDYYGAAVKRLKPQKAA